MIVLIGQKNDPVLQHFATYLMRNAAHSTFVFIEQLQLGKKITLAKDHWLEKGKPKLYHKHITSIFNRALSHGNKSTTMQQMFYHLDEVYPKVLNRPKDTISNYSKILQLDLLENICQHIRIPRSHILANHSAPKSNGPLIFKSISAHRSIVKKFNPTAAKNVTEPVLFQELLPGLNIRTTVMADKIFALSIKSENLDYRYGNHNQYKTFHLPTIIAEECKTIAQALHLPLCGIDLILYQDNYYILEVNPSPGYAFFEKKIPGEPISEAILSWLQTSKLHSTTIKMETSHCHLN
jgi:glutathione synthase/RimK-type ligase-like ATP-grasp enzyme